MRGASVAVRVRVPASLRSLAEDRAEVVAQGATVGEVVQALGRAHPALGGRLLDDQGRLRRYVNLFLGDEDVRHAEGLATPVREGDELTLVPAIAGGAPWR